MLHPQSIRRFPKAVFAAAVSIGTGSLLLMQTDSLATAHADLKPITGTSLRFVQNERDGRQDRGGRERTQLLEELARIRGRRKEDSNTGTPPLPVRRPVSGVPAEDAVRNRDGTVMPSMSASNEKILGQLLIFGFSGTERDNDGVRVIRNLIQRGLIAGVVVGKGNVVSKTQVRDLIRGLAQPAEGMTPIIAAYEFGGESSSFSFEKGFEPWPSQLEVAARGDPNYAYSTYRTMASNLEYLNFTLNFGPNIGGGDADRFGTDALKNAVYVKTFMLGHAEASITAVPISDGEEGSLRTIKSLLVSSTAMPVAVTKVGPGGVWPSILRSPLLAGPRFCFTGGPDFEQHTPMDFGQGCDVLVVRDTGERAEAIRQRIGAAIETAIQTGKLTVAQLIASASRVRPLRLDSRTAASR